MIDENGEEVKREIESRKEECRQEKGCGLPAKKQEGVKLDVFITDASGTRACLLCQELITADQGRSLTVSREPGDSELVLHPECAERLAKEIQRTVDAPRLAAAVREHQRMVELESVALSEERQHVRELDARLSAALRGDRPLLTPNELSSLQIIAVAAGNETERCLRIIERLTGQKIVAADERDNDLLCKCYYCGLPKREHSNGAAKISRFECGGLQKHFYPIRRECRSQPEIAADSVSAVEQQRMLELLDLGHNAAEVASKIWATRKQAV